MRISPLVLLLLPLCVVAQEEPPVPKLSDAECQVWARELSFAQSVADHDARAFAGHLHPGAVFGPGTPQYVRGRDAIAAQWAGLIAGKPTRLSWYPSNVVIAGEGDLAYSSGPALYERTGHDGKTGIRIGAFHTLWKRGSDGAWQVLFDDGIAPQPATQAQVDAFRAGRRADCPRA